MNIRHFALLVGVQAFLLSAQTRVLDVKPDEFSKGTEILEASPSPKVFSYGDYSRIPAVSDEAKVWISEARVPVISSFEFERIAAKLLPDRVSDAQKAIYDHYALYKSLSAEDQKYSEIILAIRKDRERVQQTMALYEQAISQMEKRLSGLRKDAENYRKELTEWVSLSMSVSSILNHISTQLRRNCELGTWFEPSENPGTRVWTHRAEDGMTVLIPDHHCLPELFKGGGGAFSTPGLAQSVYGAVSKVIAPCSGDGEVCLVSAVRKESESGGASFALTQVSKWYKPDLFEKGREWTLLYDRRNRVVPGQYIGIAVRGQVSFHYDVTGADHTLFRIGNVAEADLKGTRALAADAREHELLFMKSNVLLRMK